MKTRLSRSLILAAAAAISLGTVSTAQAEKPVKIYILAGQSNMQGKGAIEEKRGKKNSLRHLVTDAATKEEFKFAVDDNGEWRVRDDVWVYYNLAPWRELRYGPLKPGFGTQSGQIGPEFGFGHVMGEALDEQILIIKTAWGGKSLNFNFQPPSLNKGAKPTVILEIDKDHGAKADKTPGYFYYQSLEFVKHVTEDIKKYFPDYKGQGFEIAGLCWHQGWNDLGKMAPHYEKNMAAFIQDIRSKEHGLGIPDLPIVIATSGMMKDDSPIVKGQLAMADGSKYPKHAGNVRVVDTGKPYGPDKMEFHFGENRGHYHWSNNARSYTNIGRAMAAEMLKLHKK